MDGITLTVLGAALAALLGGLGSSVGVSTVGTKAAGVLGEKPELFGNLLVMTALPGSQGIYGLLIAILMLLKVGIVGGTAVSVESLESVKWILFMVGALTGLSGLISAWFQGKVAAGGVGALARDESVGGKAIVLSVIIETYAIFGLLIGIMTLTGIKL